MYSLILLAVTPPATDTGTLRPGLNPDQVTPGFLGFMCTFGVVVIMFFLIRDMVKRIRRVRYRGEVQESQDRLIAEAANAVEPGEGDAPAADGDGAVAAGRKAGGSHGPDAEYLAGDSHDPASR